MLILGILQAWMLLASTALAFSKEEIDEIVKKYNESKPLIDYVDTETFKDYVRPGVTTFLFYGVDWCGHCKQYITCLFSLCIIK